MQTVCAQLRVVLADDHPGYRSGLARVIDTDPKLDLVGEAANGAEAVSLTEEHNPDVVLLDVRMPVVDGLEAARRIGALSPRPHIVLLTGGDTDALGEVAEAAGADQLLSKEMSRRDICRRISDR